jgi:hypothetical protein
MRIFILKITKECDRKDTPVVTVKKKFYLHLSSLSVLLIARPHVRQIGNDPIPIFQRWGISRG